MSDLVEKARYTDIENQMLDLPDRLEGKAAQQIDHNVIDNREISEYSDAELSAILRRRVGVVPVESDEERSERGALN